MRVIDLSYRVITDRFSTDLSSLAAHHFGPNLFRRSLPIRYPSHPTYQPLASRPGSSRHFSPGQNPPYPVLFAPKPSRPVTPHRPKSTPSPTYQSDTIRVLPSPTTHIHTGRFSSSRAYSLPTKRAGPYPY